MKLLLFSDLHSDSEAARQLVARANDVDVLVGAGDFCNVHQNLAKSLSILKTTAKPYVLVAGNNETHEELVDASRDWPGAHILHGTGVTIAGVSFFGIGGGIPPTPFGSWSHDFSEEQATELLADCPKGCVLISHSPPKGAVDIASNGQSLGSVAVRDAVLRVQPLLVVCGHVHASAGQRSKIGSTPVINAGPSGIIWEIGAR